MIEFMLVAMNHRPGRRSARVWVGARRMAHGVPEGVWERSLSPGQGSCDWADPN